MKKIVGIMTLTFIIGLLAGGNGFKKRKTCVPPAKTFTIKVTVEK